MNDIAGMRKEAINYAKEACTYDGDGNYEEAVKYFIKAADKLNQLIKLDENKFNKDTYHKKALEYINRANELKGNTSNTGGSNTSGGSGGKNTGSSSNTSGGDDKKADKNKE